MIRRNFYSDNWMDDSPVPFDPSWLDFINIVKPNSVMVMLLICKWDHITCGKVVTGSVDELCRLYQCRSKKLLTSALDELTGAGYITLKYSDGKMSVLIEKHPCPEYAEKIPARLAKAIEKERAASAVAA